jgi:hypothetical protein
MNARTCHSSSKSTLSLYVPPCQTTQPLSFSTVEFSISLPSMILTTLIECSIKLTTLIHLCGTFLSEPVHKAKAFILNEKLFCCITLCYSDHHPSPITTPSPSF